MKIENPEWRDAFYELSYVPEIPGMGPPLRFKNPPPKECCNNPEAFNKWVDEHSIPQFIESP